MLVKLILISTICSFVYARSVESPGEIQQRLSLTGGSHFDASMDDDFPKAEVQHFHVPATLKLKIEDGTLQRPVVITNHESHPGMKHPKKRAMNYKEDRQTDLRPGCCG